MSEPGAVVQVFECDDGILLLGPDALLTVFDDQPELTTRTLSPTAMSRVGRLLTATSQAQASSGRWMKLDSESAAFLKENGISGLASGVVRAKDTAGGSGGQILKHLSFESAALATPAAPAVLGAMATQAALQAALREIRTYLAEIDAKLDQLLKQRKLEVLGQLGGVSLAIDEAMTITEATGSVSAVTWSKVQSGSSALMSMQAEAIAQLGEIAYRVRGQRGNTDESAKELRKAQSDVSFWLGVLARTIALQDQLYVVELGRVAEEDPEQLERHRQGIRVARDNRAHRIAASLTAVTGAVTESANLSNANRVANPISAQRVMQGANEVHDHVETFATHARIDLELGGRLNRTSWGRAARDLVGETADQVNAAGVDLGRRVEALGRQIQDRRDDALLRRAEQIREKRRTGGHPDQES